MDLAQMKEWYKAGKQFLMPSRILWYTSHYYPEIPIGVAQDMYAVSVEMVLTKYDVECILDLPFGKGLVEARAIYENMLTMWKRR